MIRSDVFRPILYDICQELDRSLVDNPLFHSPHEGASIIRKEFEELWDCVKTEQPLFATRHEAIQTAAMCLKFLLSMAHWVD